MSQNKKKLSLNMDTLRQLTESESQAVNGGRKGFACTAPMSLGGWWGKTTRTGPPCTAPMSVGGGTGPKPTPPMTTAPPPFC